MTTTITDVDAVNLLLARFYACWSEHDADGIAELYTEDVTVALPGVYHQGRTAGRDSLAAGFAGPLKGSRGLDTPIDIRVIDGHTAIVVSSGAALLAGEESVPEDRQRTAMWVLSKQDGEWLIAAYMNTPAH